MTPLSISIDPSRDGGEAISEYLSAFRPAIDELTGTDAQINEVESAFKAYYEIAASAINARRLYDGS